MFKLNLKILLSHRVSEFRKKKRLEEIVAYRLNKHFYNSHLTSTNFFGLFVGVQCILTQNQALYFNHLFCETMCFSAKQHQIFWATAKG